MCSCKLVNSTTCLESGNFVVDCSDGELSDQIKGLGDANALDLSRNHFELRQVLELVREMNNLNKLTARWNHIHTLDGAYLPVSLRCLSFSNNIIESIRKGFFNHLKNLQSLDISRNRIEILNDDIFIGLIDLKYLDLSGNLIFDVSNWIGSLTELRTLVLSRNDITVIEDYTFQHLHLLEKIDLSLNRLNHIHSKAFLNLHSLKLLNLSHNHLERVPYALKLLKLESLDLSHNSIRIVHEDDFCFSITNELILKGNKLILIDSQSFCQLHAQILDFSHNSQLVYIDRNAWINATSLTTFNLIGSKLTALEDNLLNSAPNLKEIYIDNDILNCDCGVNKLINFINTTNCIDAPSTCKPRIISHLLPNRLVVDLGGSVKLFCRAVGDPHPNIAWNGKLPIIGRNLEIDFLEKKHQGNYNCTAKNVYGQDSATVTIIVRNLHAKVLIMKVTSHSVTVGWRANSSSYERSYEILYRRHKEHNTSSYSSVELQPYMREYTISKLSPRTKYEFCMAAKHGSDLIPLHCKKVATRAVSYERLGILSARNYVITGAIGCIITLTAAFCGLGILVRKFNKKKRLQDNLYAANEHSSQTFLAQMDAMMCDDVTTPITFENRIAQFFEENEEDSDIYQTANTPT